MAEMWSINGMEQYRQTIRRDHLTRLVQASFSLYAWLWFHVEALSYKDPEARRPFTFIMRDWIYPHMNAFLVLMGVWYAGLLTWLYWISYPPAILLVLSSWLAAHLIRGTSWRKGQQEWPPYLGDS